MHLVRLAMIIQVQWRRIRLGLVCGLVLFGRIQWITDLTIIFFLKWLTSFCLFVATLVEVAPGLAYVFTCLHAVNSHQWYIGDSTVCFGRDGSQNNKGYFVYITSCIAPYRLYRSVCLTESARMKGQTV